MGGNRSGGCGLRVAELNWLQHAGDEGRGVLNEASADAKLNDQIEKFATRRVSSQAA